MRKTLGPLTITVDNGWARKFARCRIQIGPAIFPILENDIQAIFNNAKSKWPVKSGFSKKALKLISNDKNELRIRNYSGYANAIKGDPWGELVVDPIQKAEPGIARKMRLKAARIAEGK